MRSVGRLTTSPFAPAALVALPFVVLALRLVVAGQDPVLSGDHAALDLRTLDAAELHGSLGPYSRFGFSHPGPALFYILAPVMLVTGRAPWALHLGVQLVMAASAVAMIVVVGNRAGRLAAAGSASALLVYVAVLRLSVLKVPWNPLVIILPVALMLVATAAVRGPGVVLGIVLLAGTFIVQTNVSSGLMVVACAAMAMSFALWGLRGRRSSARPPVAPIRLAVGAAFVMTAGLLWIPPVAQQLSGQPGNAREIARFFGSDWGPKPTTGLEAAAVVGREMDLSRGQVPYLGGLDRDNVGMARSLAALGTALLAAVLLMGFGHRAGETFATRLGVVSLVGIATAVVSVTQVVGGLAWYLAAWMSACVVPILVGAFVLAGRAMEDRERKKAGTHLLVAVTAVLAVVLAATAAGAPLYESPAFPDEHKYRSAVEAAWRVVDPLVRRTGAETVAFNSAAGHAWPGMAGLAVRLERRNVRVSVPDDFLPIFGDRRRINGTEAVTILFVEPGTPPPPELALLGRAGEFTLFAAIEQSADQ